MNDHEAALAQQKAYRELSMERMTMYGSPLSEIALMHSTLEYQQFVIGSMVKSFHRAYPVHAYALSGMDRGRGSGWAATRKRK